MKFSNLIKLVLLNRFLRRLEKSIKRREKLVSPSDSCHEENSDEMEMEIDSSKATSPLLTPTSAARPKTSLCRQKRVAILGQYSALPTSSKTQGVTGDLSSD